MSSRGLITTAKLGTSGARPGKIVPFPVDQVTLHEWTPAISDEDRREGRFGPQIGAPVPAPVSGYVQMPATSERTHLHVQAVLWHHGKAVYSSAPMLCAAGTVCRFGPFPITVQAQVTG